MARILCVDDDPRIVCLQRAILEDAGHVVETATSAGEAIARLHQHDYDAVITDWRLGDGSGRSVVAAVKNQSLSALPVVVVSGYMTEAYQSAEPLADLYLEKPVDPAELVTIINELLRLSHR